MSEPNHRWHKLSPVQHHTLEAPIPSSHQPTIPVKSRNRTARMDPSSSSEATTFQRSFDPSGAIAMEKSSAVRVGVRVRPFTPKEIEASRSSESVLTCIREGTQEIRLGSRRFTYDAVFDESVSQEVLYQSVAGPLMENFLEGFNATVRSKELWF